MPSNAGFHRRKKKKEEKKKRRKRRKKGTTLIGISSVRSTKSAVVSTDPFILGPI